LFFFATLLALVPLACINLLAITIAWIMPGSRDVGSAVQDLRWWAPHRILWLAGAAQPPLFRSAIPLAVVSTLVLVILWPYLREFGLAVSVMISEGVVSGWPILTAIPSILTDHGRQWRVCRWEAWAMLRWWLLFGAWATLWLVTSWPLRTRRKLESPVDCYRRFFAFAPWIVVLELLFLVGVWIDSHNTVPEPSTGFVEGIFSWGLWRWDCWKGAVWITRGWLPTWIIASIFARYVLRWRWAPAVVSAACAVPIALDLSVAWTVWYSHALP
jgi:hypothetical protein